MIKQQILFTLSLIAIIISYLYLFGETKTLEIIKEEYLSFIAFFIIACAFLFFKFKLKNYEIREFLPNNETSLKSTIVFFLIFEVMDYYEYDGFLGMASQWFFYWLMGLIFITLMPTINYFLNYKALRKQINNQ